MSDRETLPEFLRRLSTLEYSVLRLNQKTAAGYELFLVDLSEWKLRLSDQTPLIWIKAEHVQRLSTSILAESLEDVTRELGWRNRECIVLLDGDGRRLRAHAKGKYFPRYVILDALDQQKILSVTSFTGALLDLICEQIPLSNLAPYQVGGTVVGSRFFGREREIDKILRQQETNFAVIGVRRIGKTSLLREARRRLLDYGENPGRIIWMDCSTISSPQRFVQEVVRVLHARELTRLKQPEKYLFFLPDFLKRMSKMHGGPLTIFLDEADPFVTWARDVWDLMPTLRASANAGHCRFIAAGFHALTDELYNLTSPLFLLFEPLRLGSFDRNETEDVILRPMRSLRVRFEKEREVVARIHADTRGHPLLVQFYCLELIKQLEYQGELTIGPANLEGIYTRDGFKNLIINAFRDNVSIQDKLLVYALLSSFPEGKESFTQDEMYGGLRRKGCYYSPEQVDQTCDRLVLAGVFVREGPRYRFAIPVFPQTLRANQDLDFLLSVAMKEVGL